MSVFAADSQTELQVENPRSFGHFIGDELTRRIEVTVPRAYVLEAGELPPAPGRVNRWVELTGIAAQATDTGSGRRYRIDLRYQIVDSPAEAQVTTVPAMELHFTGGARPLTQSIATWSLAVSPLAAGGTRPNLDSLRPLRRPMLIDPTAAEWRVALWSAAALGVLAVLAWRRVGRWAGTHRPFAAAERSILSLGRGPASEAQRRAALRAVHRAFDQTLGERMFAWHVDALIRSHPQFHGLRDLAWRFFIESRDEFFNPDTGTAQSSLHDLAYLCQQFAARERRSLPRPPLRGTVAL